MYVEFQDNGTSSKAVGNFDNKFPFDSPSFLNRLCFISCAAVSGGNLSLLFDFAGGLIEKIPSLNNERSILVPS